MPVGQKEQQDREERAGASHPRQLHCDDKDTPTAVATITHTHTETHPLCVRLLNAVYWPKFVLPLDIGHCPLDCPELA